MQEKSEDMIIPEYVLKGNNTFDRRVVNNERIEKERKQKNNVYEKLSHT